MEDEFFALPETAGRGVLIVEDNEINREMLSEILSEQYRVFCATDGEEGLFVLRENLRSLSLVLLDVQMPKMDGYEFLRQQQSDPFLSSVPVIVTTGSNISEDEEKCLSLGASDFVTKPYNPRVILRRCEAIIRLHESIATLNAVEYDLITGLYTKSAFHHYAQNLLDHADAESMDLLMINIEDFSYVNERYGEAVGDELLRHIGSCIRQFGEKSVISCRYHADRFVLMRKHTPCDHATESERFDRILHENAPVSDFVVKYAVYDRVPSALPIVVLCDRLSMAVKTIKRQFNYSVAYCDNAMFEKLDHLRKIEECMQDALREGQFQVYYQPKHDAVTGAISGAEALVRWEHPVYGFISPGEFVPLFEENGFITRLDLYLWRTVCRNIRDWQEAGITPVPVSVNASRRDFVAIRDLREVFDPIAEHGIDKKYLHVEITESLSIADHLVLDKVRQVRNQGICVELDDFGAGQSSLGTLTDLPIDIIKLDMGFVRDLQKKKEIVRMIISMAHALGYQVVAEGVENVGQVALLREMGCDHFQGYYYSRPLSEPDFREYLQAARHAQEEVK